MAVWETSSDKVVAARDQHPHTSQILVVEDTKAVEDTATSNTVEGVTRVLEEEEEEEEGRLREETWTKFFASSAGRKDIMQITVGTAMFQVIAVVLNDGTVASRRLVGMMINFIAML